MIRILTDSASDILPAEAEQLGVTVIPLNVTLEDGTVLRDGIDMTPTEYYAQLASCRKLPTTSQPSPELFERFYQDAAAAGDEVLGIFLSNELSGTWQCARLAADLVNVDNVLFVDSANVCLGEALLVRLAVHLRDAGKTLVQIATDLEHAKEHLHLVAAIDDLKYLRKGGSLCERALEIIEQHYSDEDLSLASLSAMLDVSPNHLSACIKKYAGETFINILIRKRMEAAQELLASSSLKVQEISRRCGYTDQHYFSYCFKKYCGESPNAMRRRLDSGRAGEGA